MTTVTVPAEIAPNIAMHENALAHFRAIERLLIPLASMTERNVAQAGEALTEAQALNFFGEKIQRIASAKVDARWLAKDAKRLLSVAREIITQTEVAIADLNGGAPAEEEALS